MNTPSFETLARAVARMTIEARKAGRLQLVLSEQDWAKLVLLHMQDNALGSFVQDVFNRVGPVKDLSELNHWLSLGTAIWNATPQPNRGGKSANELLGEEGRYLQPLPKRRFSKARINSGRTNMPPKRSPATSVYQLKVTLKDSKPPIWRRIQISNDITLSKLHHVLQISMGWTESHLHQFIINGRFYGEPDLEFRDMEVVNEKRVKLFQVATEEKAKFLYEYDFGDSWQHQIVIEKILPPEESKRYPVCLAGKRSAPPEDCGGIWGYEDFRKAISDPNHPEHEEMLEWVGGEFDPEAFDLDEINQRLRKLA